MTGHIRTSSRRSPRLFCAAAAASAVVALAAISCADLGQLLGPSCPNVGFPGILAQVRRSDGRPIGAGAKLTVRDGTFSDTSLDYGDALELGAANNRRGTYTVEVTKPYYKSFKRDGVLVPGAACGAYKTVIVPVVLEALPDAPAIRSISIRPTALAVGAGFSYQFTVFVDAAPGIDTSVTWSVSDPRVATVDGNGFLRGICATKQDALVTATSRYAPAKSASAPIGVYGAACP